MQRRYEKIYSPAIGREMQILAFGDYGPAAVAFPSGGGQYFDWENHGMVTALAPWLETGRLKLYCVEGIDNETWLNFEADAGWRAERYNAYQDFVLNNLVPAIRHDCQDPEMGIALAGCSLGAFHAVNFGLKFPHVFPYAIGMSGRYDIGQFSGGQGGMAEYFNNPMAYIPNLHGDALAHVQHYAQIVLVCGQGAWEDKCLHDTHKLADMLSAKGIRHERDIWGHDVEHHWYWWQRQVAHHFGRVLG